MAKSSSNQHVIVKKVSPYPFAATLDHGGKKTLLNIKRLTLQGFIAHIPAGFVNVGEDYGVWFEVPVQAHVVSGQVKVVKTYDTFSDKEAKKVERMAEFRFVVLSDAHRGVIEGFLSAIRQG